MVNFEKIMKDLNFVKTDAWNKIWSHVNKDLGKTINVIEYNPETNKLVIEVTAFTDNNKDISNRARYVIIPEELSDYVLSNELEFEKDVNKSV